MAFTLLTDFVDPAREAAEDELGATYGDPRYCLRHGVRISSDDGMFDGVCGACEGESDLAAQAWDVDPTNAYRTVCGPSTAFALEEDTRRHGVTCLDELEPEDGVVF